MIAKITRGSRASELAGYLHGPGRAEEHVHAGLVGGAVIGGNLALEGDREGRAWAAAFTEAAGMRAEITRPVWQASLRTAPGDRVLTDGQWADAAQSFAEVMGFEAHPWVVVRHGVDHVHVAVSRVSFEGVVWHGRQDYRAAQSACTALEGEYGLALAPRRSSDASRRVADHAVSGGEWRRAERTGVAPVKVVLAERVRAARDAAVGLGRAGFETALGRVGVEHRVNVASTGRVSGYSVHLPGHRDEAGAPVWFKASQLDRALSWNQLTPVLEGPTPQPSVQVYPRKPLELPKAYRARLAAADATTRLAEAPHAAARGAHDAQVWWGQRHQDAQQGAAERALARRRGPQPPTPQPPDLQPPDLKPAALEQAALEPVVGERTAADIAALSFAAPLTSLTPGRGRRGGRGDGAGDGAGAAVDRVRTSTQTHDPGRGRGR